MKSCNTVIILATTIICSLSTLNYYKLKKDLDYKFLWTSNGRVFLRATKASSVISIHSLDLVKKSGIKTEDQDSKNQ